MKFLADANVWLALTMEVHGFHSAVRDWFERSESQDIKFCRATQQALLRLLTTSAVWAPYALPPVSNARAWSIYDALLQLPQVGLMEETARVEHEWKNFAIRSSASPKLWMDAYLAAFARDAGLTLVTTDRAFLQFKGCNVLLLA